MNTLFVFFGLLFSISGSLFSQQDSITNPNLRFRPHGQLPEKVRNGPTPGPDSVSTHRSVNSNEFNIPPKVRDSKGHLTPLKHGDGKRTFRNPESISMISESIAERGGPMSVLAPANDVCSGAVALTAGSWTAGNNSTCTYSTSDPTESCSFAGLLGYSIWYKYTPAANGTIDVDVLGGTIDVPVVAIYEGSCGTGTLYEMDCNGEVWTSEAYISKRINVCSGSTYYIMVDCSWFYSYGPGSFNIRVTQTNLGAAPANNNCASATAMPAITTTNNAPANIVTYSTSTTGSTANACPDQGNTACFTNNQNVWYTFTPNVNINWTASVYAGTMTYPEVAIFSGSCGSLTLLGCSGDRNYTSQPYGYNNASYAYSAGCNLTAGTTYYVMVDNSNLGTAGTFTLTVNALYNDNIAYPGIISSCGSSFSSTTIGATNCGNCIGDGFYNNIDCNSTVYSGNTSGADVYSGMSVENDSYYEWCTTTAGNYTVTVTPTAGTCVGPNASSSPKLQMTLYKGSINNLTTVNSVSFGAAYTMTVALAANGCAWLGVDGFSGTNCDYSLVLSGACTLPIDLLSFTGENIDNKRVKINWVTETEQDVKVYIIERSSDAATYSEISRVESKGDSKSKQSYTTYDENPINGNNYYRLVTVERNGDRKISSAMVVTNKAHLPSFSIYPNPAKNFLNIDMNNFSSETVNLEIVDMYGRIVWSSELSTIDGNSKAQIDLSNFSGGMYFVKAFDGSTFYKKNVVISKEN